MDMSAFMAALSSLIACSTMLKRGLYRGNFLSLVFAPRFRG